MKHARDCRNIMLSDWYRRAFPGTVLKSEREHDFETTRGGGRLSTTMTGRGGEIIIDDPMKADDGNSLLARTKVRDWFSNTVMSRLDDRSRGVIILVMQRLRPPAPRQGDRQHRVLRHRTLLSGTHGEGGSIARS